MPKIFTRNTLIFLCIILVHVAYKMAYLDYSGFWYGETFNLYFSQQDWGLIKHISEWDMNPPLYYYFLWIWRNLFGEGEFAIRLSSVIFSALAAGMLYLFTVKNFNRTAAVIAVLLFSASNQLFYFSHEANCYSMLLFLGICSAYFFCNLLQEKSWASLILLGLCNFLLLYTYYSTIAILIVQFIVALIFFRKQILQRLGMALVITLTLSYLRFTKRSLELVFEHDESFWNTSPSGNDLINSFYEFFNGHNLFWILISITLISLVYLIFSKNASAALKENKIKTTYVFLSGWGTIVLSFALSYFIPMVISVQFIFAVPFLYIFIGIILSNSVKEIKYVTVGLVCFFCFISFTRIDFKTVKSMNYKEAVQTVKNLQKSETAILVETRDLGHLFAYYYDLNVFKDFKSMADRLRKKEIYLVSTAEDLAEIDLSMYKRLLLCRSFYDINPGDKQLMKSISNQFEFSASTKHFSGVTITLFAK